MARDSRSDAGVTDCASPDCGCEFRIHADGTRAMHVQDEHAARNRKILHEVDHLCLVGEVETGVRARADTSD
jgi:hypothetical protein